ncbi:hypothetical protein JTB14_006604 [Gonioctena quinquepunctata]|nr:hypothetical protein JTB14_006604 [Gonioctena quinquepunctata]
MNIMCIQTILFIIIYCACYCGGQQNVTKSTDISKKVDTSLMVPKCCGPQETLQPQNNSCITSKLTVNYEHKYFFSNETHIDTNYIAFTPTFYRQLVVSRSGFVRVKIYHDEVIGFNFNSSLIYGVDLIPPTRYCVDSEEGKIAFVMLFDNPDQAGVSLYLLPCLIISMLCCFSTALGYHCILKMKEEHKKCFIFLSLSMGFANLFEVILQIVYAQSGCNILCSLFSFFILASFVWLACLCIDLVLIIRSAKRSREENRICLYIATSLAIPSLILLITVISNGSPSVPVSFIQTSDENRCKFEGSNLLLFFVPIGFLVLLSLGCLIYIPFLMRQNENKIGLEKANWVMHRGKQKYMFYQCSIPFFMRLIYFIVELIQSFLDVSFAEAGFVMALKIISSLEVKIETHEELSSMAVNRFRLFMLSPMTK